MKQFVLAIALAGSVISPIASLASQIVGDFSADPRENGWGAFGNTNLFEWDSTNHNLRVRWDSSQSNSFFHYPLGTILAREDDFSVAFDLNLSSFAAGVDPQKPNPFPMCLGLLNLEQASRTNFIRGTGSDSPDLFEFSFFPDPGGSWIYGPSITAMIVDTNGANYWNWSSGGFLGMSLTTGDLFHVEMAYTASNQILHTTITQNGLPFGPVGDAHLGPSFTDFRIDHFAVCSYSDAGQDPAWAGSILAEGVLDNIQVVLPPPPVQDLTGAFSNSVWQVQFLSRSNWLYTLERATDFQSWSALLPVKSGVAGTLELADTNVPLARAFYRVRANRP